MLTPMDIHNKEFEKGFRGYSEKDVDAFMQVLATDYEVVYRDNRELQEVVTQLREKIRHYEQMENTMNSTLMLAQETAENVKVAARKEADLIIQTAEQQKRTMLEETLRSLRDAQEKYEIIRQDIAVFKAKMQSILSSQMQLVDDMVLGECKLEAAEVEKTIVDVQQIHAEYVETADSENDIDEALVTQA